MRGGTAGRAMRRDYIKRAPSIDHECSRSDIKVMRARDSMRYWWDYIRLNAALSPPLQGVTAVELVKLARSRRDEQHSVVHKPPLRREDHAGAPLVLATVQTVG